MLIDMFTPILTAAKLCTNCWNSVVFIKDWRMHGSDHEVPQIVHNRCHDAIFPRSIFSKTLISAYTYTSYTIWLHFFVQTCCYCLAVRGYFDNQLSSFTTQ